MIADRRMVTATARRTFSAWLVNPTGAAFTTAFILFGAIAAFWQPRFFRDNLANLDALNAWMPLLMTLFVPALAMNAWSEERRLGTDELLLTLPARDLDVVLGKFLGLVLVLTVALGFSLSHVLVLARLGDPDPGLVAANFLGAWLLGATLLAVAMTASIPARNATVAFLGGAGLAAACTFVDAAGTVLPEPLAGLVAAVGVRTHVAPFHEGLVSIPAVLAFAAIVAAMLHLQVVLLGRRHVVAGPRAAAHALHGLVRTVSIAAIGLSASVAATHAGPAGLGTLAIDATAERLHTLQPSTRRLLARVPADRPVFIRAYLSPEVPESHAEVRKNLVAVLRRMDEIAGPRVEVTVIDVEPFSPEADEARDHHELEPRELPSVRGSRRTVDETWLGLVFTSGPEERTIPFFDRGLPVEYELARAVGSVVRSDRRVVGVLDTDANPFASFDFREMTNRPDWSIVRELRTQYDLRRVNADGPWPDDLDALVAILPSTMPQAGLDRLRDAVLGGLPVLLADDPLPIFRPTLSPRSPREEGGAPFLPNAPTREPKGDFERFLADLGLALPTDAVVWNAFNPYPGLASIAPEMVFVRDAPDNPDAFPGDSPITRGLQEIVMLHPGEVGRADGADGLAFTPLATSGTRSGHTDWNTLLVTTPAGPTVAPNPRRTDTEGDHVLAARVTGRAPASPPDGPGIDLVVLGDVDVLSETFFDLRRRGLRGFRVDNVAFVMNAIDVLLGEDDFLALRTHRPRHRTLERLEAATDAFERERRAAIDAAEAEGRARVEEARARLREEVAALEARGDLDERTRRITIAGLEEAERRRLRVLEASIARETARTVERARIEMQRAVDAIERGIRLRAALLPPIPPLLLAVALAVRRARRERIGVPASRLVGAANDREPAP